tara:strand:+ start:4 stop:1137 length:1134 start_codon:yes stop_codon:yes gene_type:complete
MYLTGYNNTTASEIHLKANNTYNTGHFHLDDNDYLKIGSSDDLNLYHDSNNSFVQHTGTGGLYIDALNNSADIVLRSQDNINMFTNSASQNAIDCVGNGGVLLYHQGNKKFETISHGIDVQGSVFCLGTTPQLRLNSDTSDGSSTRAMLGMATSANNFVNGSTANDVVLNCPKDFIISHGTTELMAQFKDDSSVQLYCDSSMKLQTRSDGISVYNELSVGTSDIQSASVASFVGGQYNQVNIADTSNTGWGLLLAQQQGTSNTSLYTYSTNSSTNKPCSIVNVKNDALHFGTNNTARFRIEHDGHVIPSANNSYDLGSSTYRWRNIYTMDLQLSNKDSKNDVDGTWGDYTIQEGESDLFLINNRNGKKYKFNLTEVS